MSEQGDGLTTVEPALSRIPDFESFLAEQVDDEFFNPLHRAEIVGRPIGSDDFIQELEKQTNRTLNRQKGAERQRRKI